MKTKHLLTGLVLPALFAACTAEEIESSKGVLTQEDLSARPSVGNVVLNFGNAESRAELGDNAFNSIEFNAEEDAIGARIIDEYAAAGLKDADGERVAWKDYSIIDKYASSNYQYVYNGECWETTALMVEGNYMFYYPYNAKNVARGPLEIITPTHQVVKPNEVDGERNPIAELYAGENPAFVGYKFIDAKDQDLAVSVDMQHVFAYPQITLVNDFTTLDKRGREVETDLTITKIVLSSSTDDIVEKYTINHTAFRNALTPEFSYLAKATDKKETVLIEAGNWTEAETLLKEATIDAIAKASNKTVEIEVEFEGGLELAYGDEYSFNVVLPALAYTKSSLNMQVYTEDDMMIGTTAGKPKNFTISKDMTFAPGKRYATQEYNFPATGVPAPKKSAGNLAVYELGGKNLDLIDAVAPVAVINDIKEFEAYLETIGRNVEALKEIDKEADRDADADNFILAPALGEDGEELGYANLVVDEALLALLDEYNYAGNIEFVSTMLVKGAKEAPNAAKEIEEMSLGNADYSMTFAKAIVTEGYVTANEYTSADEIEVLKGVLTIADAECEEDADAAELKAVVVKGGETVVTDPCFDPSVITAGYALNAKETAVATTGKVTLNYEGTTAAPAVVGGELIIGSKVKIDETPVWSPVTVNNVTTWGRITNNGVIESSLTVASGVELTNNGKFTKNNNTNKGKIIANADMTIGVNTGVIVVGDDLVEVTVSDATATNKGSIDNTEGGKVFAQENQDVYAELESLVDDGDAEDEKILSQKYDYYSGIDRYKLVGEWTVKGKDVKLEQVVYNPDGTQSVERSFEFASGSSLNISAGAKLTFTHDIIISSNVAWTGRDKDGSFLNIGDNDIVFKKNADNIFYNVTVKNLTTDKNPQEFLLRDALAEGGNATINDDVDLTSYLIQDKDVTTVLNLNGKTVERTDGGTVFYVTNGNLTLKGNGDVISKRRQSGKTESVVIYVDGRYAEVTVENGYYETNGDAPCVYIGEKGGKVIIWDGEFINVTTNKDEKKFLLNVNDAAYDARVETMVVKGGKFYDFNPSVAMTETDSPVSYLAEEYTVEVYRNSGVINFVASELATSLKPTTAGEKNKTFGEQAWNSAWGMNYAYKVVAE